MLVRDAMVANPLVVPPTMSLFEFVDRILAGNQTTAAVVENGWLLGVVSATDVLKPLVPSYVAMDAKLAGVLRDSYFEEELGKLRNVQVQHAMARMVDTLPPDASVLQAVVTFVAKGRKTLPVVDGRKFLGCVTRRSVLTIVRQSVTR
jgi:CBS-domain-containing membrane protein